MANEIVLIVFYVGILLYSVILHEVMHGVMAMWLGDMTAKYAGRITANPFRHIDPWLTIGMPFLMLIITNFKFAFGGAKPVPYNPYNLRDQRWGPAWVALAGPGSNIIIALMAAVLAKFIAIPAAAKIDIINNIRTANWESLSLVISNSLGSIFFTILIITIFWNVLLAVFNLIPIPPLDGSKLLFSIFSVKVETLAILEQFGFIILLFVVFVFNAPIAFVLNLFWILFFNITI